MRRIIKCHPLVSGDDIKKKVDENTTINFQRVFRMAGVAGFLIMFFVSFTFAQIPKPNPINEIDKVPLSVRNGFEENYSDVENVTWKVEEGYFKVSFTKDNKPLMAFFNYDDELIGEGYYVEYTVLPEKARERIAQQYPDYSPQKSMFFQNNKSNESDFLNFSGSTLPDESYFVLIKQDTREIVLNVTKDGDVAHYSRTHAR